MPSTSSQVPTMGLITCDVHRIVHSIVSSYIYIVCLVDVHYSYHTHIIIIIIESTMPTIPQMIPAFAIQCPWNSWGFSLILLIAIAPKIIANGPRIIPINNILIIPKTNDAIAMGLFFGMLAPVVLLAVALAVGASTKLPMAIAAVGLAVFSTGAATATSASGAEPVEIDAVGTVMITNGTWRIDGFGSIRTMLFERKWKASVHVQCAIENRNRIRSKNLLA